MKTALYKRESLPNINKNSLFIERWTYTCPLCGCIDNIEMAKQLMDRYRCGFKIICVKRPSFSRMHQILPLDDKRTEEQLGVEGEIFVVMPESPLTLVAMRYKGEASL